MSKRSPRTDDKFQSRVLHDTRAAPINRSTRRLLAVSFMAIGVVVHGTAAAERQEAVADTNAATASESRLANPKGDKDKTGNNRSARAPTAAGVLKFTRKLTAECMLHRAQLLRIVNTDPERAVRVVLWSYTGRTRSQGSSVKILPPDSGPVALGCDGVSGLKRRWRIERARFVAPKGHSTR